MDRTAYSKKACYGQALKHKPNLAPAWYSLGFESGGTVDRTAYSKRACYEQALKHKPDLAPAWYSLGFEGGGAVDRTAYSQHDGSESRRLWREESESSRL